MEDKNRAAALATWGYKEGSPTPPGGGPGSDGSSTNSSAAAGSGSGSRPGNGGSAGALGASSDNAGRPSQVALQQHAALAAALPPMTISGATGIAGGLRNDGSGGFTPADLSPFKPRPATVTMHDGKLSFDADGAELNQMLQQISTLTGMVIHGRATTERVFGKRGPAKPNEVIAFLLYGTASNFILREGTEGTVLELDLTPRPNGVAPPMLTAGGPAAP